MKQKLRNQFVTIFGFILGCIIGACVAYTLINVGEKLYNKHNETTVVSDEH